MTSICLLPIPFNWNCPFEIQKWCTSRNGQSMYVYSYHVWSVSCFWDDSPWIIMLNWLSDIFRIQGDVLEWIRSYLSVRVSLTSDFFDSIFGIIVVDILNISIFIMYWDLGLKHDTIETWQCLAVILFWWTVMFVSWFYDLCFKIDH